jgi:hypothetical protein
MSEFLLIFLAVVVIGIVVFFWVQRNNAASTSGAGWDEHQLFAVMTRVFSPPTLAPMTPPGPDSAALTFQFQPASGIPFNFNLICYYGEEQADRGIVHSRKRSAKQLIIELSCQLHIDRAEVSDPDAIKTEWEQGLSALKKHLEIRARTSAELSDDNQRLRFRLKREAVFERSLGAGEADAAFEQTAMEWKEDMSVFAQVSKINRQHV